VFEYIRVDYELLVMELSDPDNQISTVQSAPQRTRLSKVERDTIIQRLIAEKRRNLLTDEDASSHQPQPQLQPQPLTEHNMNTSTHSMHISLSASTKSTSNSRIEEHPLVEEYDPSQNRMKGRRSITSSSDNIPLFDRAVKWQKDRENEMEKRREEKQKAEIESCPFKPQTASRPPSTPTAPVTERLYQV